MAAKIHKIAYTKCTACGTEQIVTGEDTPVGQEFFVPPFSCEVCGEEAAEPIEASFDDILVEVVRSILEGRNAG